jgi:hypothetical protein
MLRRGLSTSCVSCFVVVPTGIDEICHASGKNDTGHCCCMVPVSSLS